MAKEKKYKLELCPFCGSDAELVEIDEGQFCVRCTQCNASGDYYGTELGARASWNDRRGFYKKKILQTMAFDVVVAVVYFSLLLLILGIIKMF